MVWWDHFFGSASFEGTKWGDPYFFRQRFLIKSFVDECKKSQKVLSTCPEAIEKVASRTTCIRNIVVSEPDFDLEMSREFIWTNSLTRGYKIEYYGDSGIN